MSHISIRNVRKTYYLGKTEVHALQGVSLEITRSEFIGIIGPSGSGKSTLLNMIGGIDVPTEGEVIIDGTNTGALTDTELTLLRRRSIGIIFQSFNLIPVLNAFENVELPLVSLGMEKEERRRLASDMLEKTGIGEYAHHKPDELSGGQRQRVAIARALVTKPGIVLADEPTANLDTETGNRIVEIMKHMNETMSTTFIISTHDPRLLEYIDRRIFLKDGLVVRTEEKDRV